MTRKKRSGPAVPPAKTAKANSAPTAVNRLMAKARTLAGQSVDERQALEAIDSQTTSWGQQGAVEAPYDPESLLAYIELSPHLTPCLDAYCQNIEGYGFHFEPAEPWMRDLDSEAATVAIREAIAIERWVDDEESHLGEGEDEKRQKRCKAAPVVPTEEPVETPPVAPPAAPEAGAGTGGRATDDQSPGMPEETPSQTAGDLPDGVTEADVEQRREEIRTRLRREEYLASAWFRNCCSESSFVKLRRKVRWDIEAHGWGAIEFVRDAYGRLKRLGYVSAYTVRPLVDEGDAVEVVEDDSVTPLSEGREVKVWRKFRRFIQEVNGRYVYFKSPGDPRLVSGYSGDVYLDEEEPGVTAEELFKREEGEKGAKPANELLYIPLHSPRTPCPPPRWIGNLLAVLGVRESDEMNLNYFSNRSVPPAIMFVSGGKLPKDIRERIEGKIANEIRGVDNAHKILVVEALAGSPRGTAPGERSQLPQMTFQPLRDQQVTDAVFQQYDIRSADRVGASFRLSPILRGLTNSNMNRATAEAALYQAEQQVFQPEREDVDWLINKVIMPELGVKFVRFVSNTPPTTAPETLLTLMGAGGAQGAFIPNEVREIAGLVLNKPFEPIDEDWAKQPIQLTLAGQGGGGGGGFGGAFGASAPAAGQTEEEVAAGDVSQRLRRIELRLEQIISEELRASGYDAEIRAHFLGTNKSGG